MVPRAHNHAPVDDFIWCVPTVKDPRPDECRWKFTVAAIQNGFNNTCLDVRSNFLGFISLKRMEQYNKHCLLPQQCHVQAMLTFNSSKAESPLIVHTCLDKQEGFNPTEHSQTIFLHE